MKGLSVHQPWAWLIANGKKTIETRTWDTYHRGEILIVSTKKKPSGPGLGGHALYLPRGVAVATARIIDSRPMTKEDELYALCSWQENLFSWVLSEIKAIATPFPVRGMHRLFTLSSEIFERVSTAQYISHE